MLDGRTFDHINRREPEPGVEAHRRRFGVDDDADAAVVVRHAQREAEHEAQELQAQALPLRWPINAQSGLGLATCQNIVVKNHGGSIDVVSRPGCTRFTVALPIRRP